MNYLHKEYSMRDGNRLKSPLKKRAALAPVILSLALLMCSGIAAAQTLEQKAAVLSLITVDYLAKRVPPEGVCVYTETGFRGHRQCFTESVALLNEKLNDQVSSVVVSSAYKLTVYQDVNFSGGFINYNANSATIDGLDNMVSSVAVALIGDTTNNEQVNPFDADSDGVNDVDDFCANTTAGASVNQNGCSSIQILNGGGGGSDTFQCIDPVTGVASNDPNCPAEQRDSDFDGVVDGDDPYPLQDGTQCYP